MNRDFFVLCSGLCAAIGALLYAALAFGLILEPDYTHFGADIYDAYFHRLATGRFDLPMRLLGYEGHYTSDATGFLYHGLAPLLTRLFLAPFVELGPFPTAAFSICLWAIVGTGIYHLLVVQVVQKFAGRMPGNTSAFLGILTGLGIWISGPGLLISSNTALYHEPISIAYAVMALAVFVMTRCALFDLSLRRSLVVLAILAGILLHARPHMAAGLYVGLAVMIGLSLRNGIRSSLVTVIATTLILVTLAVTFAGINVARFGAATQVHGQFGEQADKNIVKYGTVFWGLEKADSDRARAFTEHGTFHPWRILPNLFVYVLDAPIISKPLRALHALITENISGFGRIEGSGIGMLLLWPLWIVLMLSGLIFARPRITGGVGALPVLLTTSVAELLMLSYPTITLRYRFDLWPLVITLCVLSFPGLMRSFGPHWLVSKRILRISFGLVACGVLFSGLTAVRYVKSFQAKPDGFFSPLDANECAVMVIEKGFASSEIARICVDPDSVYSRSSKG